MEQSKFKFSYLHALTVAFILVLGVSQRYLNIATTKPKFEVSKQDDALNFNENFLRLSSLGQERLLSSLLWITTLIESDIEHYKKRNLNSWMYLRFKSISVLDPYFYENYLYGGKYLSIVKDDLLGAEDIYQRGLKYYPHDFHLRFNHAFNYYFELEKKNEGLKNFALIENHPHASKYVPYLPSMIARMRAEQGDKKLAYEMLLRVYQETEGQNIFKEQQAQRLYELKKEIDLECLNNNKKGCSLYDFKGRPYIQSTTGEYRAQGFKTN